MSEDHKNLLAVVDIFKQHIKDESFDVVSTVEGVDLLLAVIDDSLSIEDIDADIFSLLNDNLPLFVNHLMRTPSRSDSDEIMRALQVIVRLI